METYYCRHTWKLDVNKEAQHKLWKAGKVFVHFPHNRNGALLDQDNSSLDPNDYGRGGKQALSAMTRLSNFGGYVCAEHHDFPEPMLGFVKPGTPVTIEWATWGGRWCRSDRPAALKTLELQKVHNVTASKALGFLVARPRMGTFMRWPQVKNAVHKIVENQQDDVCLADLSSCHQETLCAEFLRSPLAPKLDLPQIESLLLPIGRTLRDIDIYGLQGCGRRVLAQVTFLPFAEAEWKLNALNRFQEDTDVDRILFCLSEAVSERDGMKIVPLQQVFNWFTETPSGQRWIQNLFV